MVEYTKSLDYLPKKERKAAEEALYIGEDPENLVPSIIRQINRKPENPEKQRRNVYERF